jgi:hypothetical protein
MPNGNTLPLMDVLLGFSAVRLRISCIRQRRKAYVHAEVSICINESSLGAWGINGGDSISDAGTWRGISVCVCGQAGEPK